MALGTGLSAAKVDFIDSGYSMGGSILFDGADDFGRFGLESLTPANGTMKPVDENGLTLAAWFKLTDDESDGAGIYNTTANQKIFGCTISGGFSLYFGNKRMNFHIRLQDGAGNFSGQTAQTEFGKMRLFSADQDSRPLYKSDGWHFVVGTWDGNRVSQIYVDGGRNLGYTSGSAFGSAPETSDTKKTAAAPTGNNPSGNNKWYIKYVNDAVDSLVGCTGTFNAGNSPKTSVGSEYFGGYIGDICQWNRELTSSEISTLYNYHVPIDMATMHPNDITGLYRAKDVSGTSWPAAIGNNNITLGQAMSVNALVPSQDVTALGGGYA